jgi:LuxR family transcriptional regulator, maltose regulon positive regulatory protein
MDSSLVATKLRIPPRPHHEVARPRLVDVFEREIPQHKFTLVTAPAGYGKTTLLSQWAHESQFSVVWLSIDHGDNDFHDFFRYLLAGWEGTQPDVRTSSLGLLLSGMMPEKDAVLSAFINFANMVSGHLVFILDDYHLIEDKTIHEALAFLLDHLPPELHLVVAGRGQSALPLARYRARGELLEVRVDDLQFSPTEAETFFTSSMGLPLTSEQTNSLHARLEGWIAGLQLVALMLRRNPNPETHEIIITGRHRYIADYLAEDVLADLPHDRRMFLLRTSILDPLTAPLCAAVTESSSNSSQVTLDTLERKGLFLMPQDEDRLWFRYHRLFADVLREELNRHHPGEVPTLHQRAARWYLANDLPDPAFEHAVKCQDVELVGRILHRYLDVKLFGGEFHVVRRWLEMLPEEWINIYPDLGLVDASLLLFSGTFELVERRLTHIEQMLTREDEENVRSQFARVTAMRCFIACFQNNLPKAERYADQALRDLPDEDLTFRPGIYGALGDTYRANGRWKEAQESYLKLLDFSHAPGFFVQSVHLYGALADLNLRQGHLSEAASYWEKALTVIRKPEIWGRVPLSAVGWVYTRMAEILYEWNELEEAREHLSHGLERAELTGDARTMIASCVIGCRLKLTEGDIVAASGYLERARPLLEQAPIHDWVSRFERLQLELWLAEGKLRTAVNWSDTMLQDNTVHERPESEIAVLAMARVLITKGDMPALQRAMNLLEVLHDAAESEGRKGVQVEAIALGALAHWKRGDRASAMTSLERALRLAEPEGYLRLFVDLGPQMLDLMREARSRKVMPDYVGILLTALTGAGQDPRGPEMSLPEPLTTREAEILRLLAAGLTNLEIADRLYISPETVKKHTTNIYGKLGVRRRTEAVARARSLDLLEESHPL